MTTLAMIGRMLDSMIWADERTLQALQRLEGSTDERYAAARRYWHHVLAAERVWLARLLGEPGRAPEIWPSLSEAEARRWAAENREAYRRYLESLSEDDLERRVEYANSSGRLFRTAVGDVLVHVAMHGAYHRGQVARAVREAGGEPVNTDFITYVRALDEAERQESATGATGATR